jgi:hypothetical protein
VSARSTELQRRLRTMRAGRARVAPAAASAAVGKAPADWLTAPRQTEAGPLHLVQHLHAVGYCQGSAPLADGLATSAQHLVRLSLDSGFAGVDPARLLYLDTETTGLARGAGTVAFLVGVAYFVGPQLQVEQWVLRRMGEEVPILERLAALLAGADAIVTYNGKCFDWPLLCSRFTLNRLPAPPVRPHLDLLHCTRRVLRHRAPATGPNCRPSMRLTQIEQDLLGFTRRDDIPGYLVPELYFRYLRGGGAGLLDPVLVHNRHDLVSLAALLGVLVRRLDDVSGLPQAADRLAMAELNVRGGATAQALRFAEAAAVQAPGPVQVSACLLVARLLGRRHRFEQAARALLRGLPASAPQRHAAAYAPLHLALSKLYEHKLSDLTRAAEHARFTAPAEGAASQTHRMARLLRRGAQPHG